MSTMEAYSFDIDIVQRAYRMFSSEGAWFCAGCGRKENLLQDECFPCCNRCKSVSYCSRECQVKHWRAQHKALCDPNIFASDARGSQLTRRINRFIEKFNPLILSLVDLQFNNLRGHVGLENLSKHMLVLQLVKIDGVYTIKSTNFAVRDPEMVPPNEMAGTHALWTRPVVFIDNTDPLQPFHVTQVMQKIDVNGPPTIASDVLTQCMAEKFRLVINDMSTGKRPDLIEAAAKAASEAGY